MDPACVHAATVFSDDFSYPSPTNWGANGQSGFVNDGGWTTANYTGTENMGAGNGVFWGDAGGGVAVLEYNYSVPITVGTTLEIDATIDRTSSIYHYAPRIFLWDGTNSGSRQQIAFQVFTGSPVAPNNTINLSHTVTSGDMTGGLNHVIFQYGNEGTEWGQTSDVTMSVTPVPEPSSSALLALGGLGLLIRRR